MDLNTSGERALADQELMAVSPSDRRYNGHCDGLQRSITCLKSKRSYLATRTVLLA